MRDAHRPRAGGAAETEDDGHRSGAHRRTDPGDPDVCPVGDLHKIFSSKETMAKVYEGCRSAGIGCIECKSWAADALVKILNPMQERRKKYEDNPRLAWDILEAGSARAREVAGRYDGRSPRFDGAGL
jgi:tryptophanyl-tRNA synthetase